MKKSTTKGVYRDSVPSAGGAQALRASSQRLVDHQKIFAFVLWLLLTIWALWISNTPELNWSGRASIYQFLSASFQPELNPTFLGVMAKATLTTFAFAVCGTTLSLVIGLVLGVVCSRVWWQIFLPGAVGRAVWIALRGGLAIPRAIHEVIWGLLLLSVLGLDPIVGVGAIAIPFGAITAKVFSEIIDETPIGPLTALVNSGSNRIAAFCYAQLPQALPNLISYGFYRFECSLRAAAVLGIIGAGGLGEQIFLSWQSLQYAEVWTGFYALILLNGLVDTWSAKLRRQMGFVSRLDLADKSKRALVPVATRQTDKNRTFVWGSLIAIALCIPLCFAYLNIDWGRIGRSVPFLADLASELTAEQVLPAFSFSLVPLALQTMAMSILAINLAGIGGVLFSFPAAQNFFLPGGLLQSIGSTQRLSLGHGVLVLSRMILLAARAIPAPILALIVVFGMYPGIWPGALALAAHNFGILGRLMAEVNENLPDGPLRALRSLGASSSGIVFYGVFPANLPRFLAYILYRWEVCLRETVIVGIVGVGGLGRLMTEQLSSFDYGSLAATLLVFIGLTIFIDAISGWMRTAVR
ncbi:phosphonate ABC transporter, permease protein, putative [Synechococcus sp. PCC 7335]|uniref:PhnE/PtxC family ABC transporter permease n=1 Tax=Synechococcus sp. (strain ATCC 29403 / PCC 7335) TaxID=91464 RepID=UPI00017ED264|nr:ABC transporter permease subunit [Synechococcus sp. PCC 7335]EDX84957.1 phosphonate ABC transporter, permease protein, putative [Synechococcus sp. PCC 7335]